MDEKELARRVHERDARKRKASQRRDPHVKRAAGLSSRVDIRHEEDFSLLRIRPYTFWNYIRRPLAAPASYWTGHLFLFVVVIVLCPMIVMGVAFKVAPDLVQVPERRAMVGLSVTILLYIVGRLAAAPFVNPAYHIKVTRGGYFMIFTRRESKPSAIGKRRDLRASLSDYVRREGGFDTGVTVTEVRGFKMLTLDGPFKKITIPAIKPDDAMQISGFFSRVLSESFQAA